MSEQQEITSQPEAQVTSGEISNEAKDVSSESVTPATESSTEAEADVFGLDSFLSDDLKQIKSLQNFKDVDGLAKSYVHLNGLLGKKFEDLSSEELDGYYGKLGRPETSAEYKFPDSPQSDLLAWYKEKAFKLGLNQNQARDLMESYGELEQARMKETEVNSEQLTNEWIEEIKSDFGTAFNKRVEIAKKAVLEFGGSDLKNYLNESGLGNHPAMVRAFAKIGKELLEDRLTDNEATLQFGLTPEDAKQKIRMLQSDVTFDNRYRSATDPGHQDAVKEMQDLYLLAFPEK